MRQWFFPPWPADVLGAAFMRFATFIRRAKRASAPLAASFALCALTGCSVAKMPILNPIGDVGAEELELLKLATIVMAVIVVPIMIGTLWVAWRYRAGGDKKGYDPEFDDSPTISKITVYVPLLTIAVLGALTWVYTHRLDPYRVRPGGTSPIPYEIQAIALDYKWLFVYPEAGVATVNELVAPTNRAVTIRITSDPMMTALFIPGLISQIYAMTGMETRANFMAPTPAELDGANAMYSGPEFFKQRFKTRLVSEADFKAWLGKVGAATADAGGVKAGGTLNFARYQELAKRTPGYPVTYFAAVEPMLFQTVARQYEPRYTMNPLPTQAPAQKTASADAPSSAKHQGH